MTELVSEQPSEHADLHAPLRQKQLITVSVREDGSFIDHVYREPSHLQSAEPPYASIPDRVFIERYHVNQYGKIELLRIIEGTHTPGFYTPETFIFDEKDLENNYV